MKKIETTVTLARGGMHSPSEYRKAVKMLRENTFKRARLYHFILKGSPVPKDYNRAADGIARLLRSKGIECTGKACWERNAKHGLHFHFFVLVEASHGRVDHWLNPAEDGPLKTMLRELSDDAEPKHIIKVHIAPPGNAMHRTMTTGEMPLYQYVPKSGPKLEDAVIRISYLYKNDTKDNTMSRIYYSTRKRVSNAPEQAQDAAVAPAQPDHPVHAQATQDAPEQAAQAANEQEETMTPTTLTEAVFLHVGEIYEQAVDAGMHLGDVQRHLGSRGIHKPMLAIKNELNNLYCFYGYADSHPAPRAMSYAEVDAVLAKSGRRTSPETNLRGRSI